MASVDSGLSQTAACLYLATLSAFFGSSLALLLVQFERFRAWRRPALGGSAALAGLILAAFALLVREPTFQALSAAQQDSLVTHLVLQVASAFASAVFLAGAWVQWGSDPQRVLPWSAAIRREGRLRAGLSVVPVRWIAGGVLAVGALTWVLFTLVEARPAPDLRPMLSAIESNPWVPFLLLVPGVVFEELVFRGCFQGWLRGILREHDPGAWTSILIPAVIWSLGHAGQVEPDFPKLLQIFGLGLLLGETMERHGLEAAILLHLLFNLSTVLPIYPAVSG